MKKLHEEGHIVAKTFYARVTACRKASWSVVHEMECTDLLNKESFVVRGSGLVEQFVSADTFESEEGVTKTELARKLVDAGPAPFTVCYRKARGEERILRGRLLEHEDLLGRSLVHDFDVEKGTPLREVDHRTLQWLIINGVKYTLKGKQ